MSAKKKETQAGEPFEKSLERLESIVRQLEGGEKGVEESLRLFEQGASLAGQLGRRLEQVKQRVEVLIKESKVGPLTKEGPERFRAEPLEGTQREE